MVLSHAVWTTHFSRDPAAIGEQLTLDGLTHTIVGVMPARFRFPADAVLWRALGPPSERVASYRFTSVAGESAACIRCGGRSLRITKPWSRTAQRAPIDGAAVNEAADLRHLDRHPAPVRARHHAGEPGHAGIDRTGATALMSAVSPLRLSAVGDSCNAASAANSPPQCGQ